MSVIRRLFSEPWVASALGLALAVAAACKVNPPPKQTSEQPATPAKSGSGHYIELNCIGSRMQNPPESFHYSFKQASTSRVEEGDFTPEKIDERFQDKIHTQPFVKHIDRANAAAWRLWSTVLDGFETMNMFVQWSNGGSWMVREGEETINGYHAVKYSIDSARGATPADVFGRKELGPGGFEKGTVWLLPDGCPVKFILDAAVSGKNGSVYQDHWEEDMVKK